MRTLVALCAACLIAGCGSEQAPRGRPQAASSVPVRAASADPGVQRLLTVAARDFHTHQPPYPERVRGVRSGHRLAPDGTKKYVIRGEFREKGGDWTPFVTIQTSDYEQLLGSLAEGYIREPSITWNDGEDLSSALQSRLDSL